MIKRAYATTAAGQLHFAEAGTGPVLLCLHQAARSHDEFLEILPLLARGGYRAIAMDMLGYGFSARLEPPETIEAYARGAVALLDALGVEQATILGHHTGGAVAIELAAAYPERVHALILSSTNFLGEEYRAKYANGPGLEDFPQAPDGSHVMALWRFRAPYYPTHRPDLLNRFIVSALQVDPAEGHVACKRYRMDDRIGLVRAPTLIVAATEDIFTFPVRHKIQSELKNAASTQIAEIQGGLLPLFETKAPQVAEAVLGWLSSIAVR